MRFLILCALIGIVVCCAPKAPAQTVDQIGLTADSTARIGSFEFAAGAPLIRLKLARERTLALLKAGTITKPEAVAFQTTADSIRSKVDLALAICKSVDGRCTGNAPAALTLLQQAAARFPICLRLAGDQCVISAEVLR